MKLDNKLLNTVHCMDCLEFMKTLPDGCIDLVLTDPPYWIGIDTAMQKVAWTYQWNGVAIRGNYWSSERDTFRPTEDYFEEIQRISKQAIIFWWNYFADVLPASRCWLVWDKNNWTNDFADCELARTNFTTSVRKYTRTRNGMLQEDMKNKENRQHPTQKPVWLFRQILEDCSEQWDTILDCFAWSWTTWVACKELWRNYILVEKEPKYVDIINRRLANTTISLFHS